MVDGVLGTKTLGGRMVSADESTELWRHPQLKNLCHKILILFIGTITTTGVRIRHLWCTLKPIPSLHFKRSIGRRVRTCVRLNMHRRL